MDSSRQPILGMLERYRPRDETEAADVERVQAMVRTTDDPWLRAIPLHVTASALVVHPDTGQVLLRWHQRQQAWLQVGGHGDPGESDPLAIALREAREESGLTDLVPWPDPEIQHVVIVAVPASAAEPAHEHADVRFILATGTPQAARAERPGAPLRWLPMHEARQATSEANLLETMRRTQHLLEQVRGRLSPGGQRAGLPFVPSARPGRNVTVTTCRSGTARRGIPAAADP
jgi:8-oxo-dGTP pyrophosphatase MutT (NUDIX family)